MPDRLSSDVDASPKYRAPALEKGLDILELLSREDQPLNAIAISERLGRSPGELFRMIQVLEYRGFIRQAPGGSGFEPTEKMFALGIERPQVKSLLETSLPLMRELSRTIGQSCHLSVRSGRGIVVVARSESSEQIGFSVRIGHRLPMLEANSAVVHYAFLADDDRARWVAQDPNMNVERLTDFKARAIRARAAGYECAKSKYIIGVTDLTAPIIRGGNSVAALTVPFVNVIGPQMPMSQAVNQLCRVAARISERLIASDHRP